MKLKLLLTVGVRIRFMLKVQFLESEPDSVLDFQLKTLDLLFQIEDMFVESLILSF